jgi:PLP dependent protein
MVNREQFLENLHSLRARIAAAAAACGRDPASVRILPVTKTHPAGAVALAAAAGLAAVGENRVQEAVTKREDWQALRAADSSLPDVEWELIGHLQSNKARLAAGRFHCIQTLDSPKLARLLDAALAETGGSLAVLLQVNAGRDPAKSGAEPEEAAALLDAALALPRLRVRGLMTIAPLSEDPSVADRTFEALRELRDRLEASHDHPLPELSMGMSGDLEAAVRAGSTVVRVGTALFGTR